MISKKMKLNRYRDGLSFRITKAVMFVLFVIYAASLLYPLAFIFLFSLRSNAAYEARHFSFSGIIGFDNYVSAFKYLPMTTASGKQLTLFHLIFNSLWYTLLGCGLQLTASCMTAYVISKYKFPGRSVLYAVAIITLTLPIVGQIPSQFKMYDKLHILNSPLLVVSFFSGFGFSFIVLFSFFQNISWQYAEAAFIDGAGHLCVFLRIMLPHAAGIIGALFIVTCVNYWNDYLGPVLFLPDYPTLASGLYKYKVLSIRDYNMGGVNMPILFAGLLVSMLPVVGAYIAFNKKMLDMSFSGGLKG